MKMSENKEPSPSPTCSSSSGRSVCDDSPPPIKLRRLSSPHSTSTPPAPGVALMHTIKVRLEDVLGVPEANSLTMESKTRSLMHYYGTLIPEDREQFLRTLATDYGVDQKLVLNMATATVAAGKERSSGAMLRVEDRLRTALIPRYQQLFTHLSRHEQGVKFLVDIRTDLLSMQQSHSQAEDLPHLNAMSLCLRDLLSLWFSVGFLQLERITWQSPCDMLQKISEYEAVHPIKNWTDLKRRVGLYRRCFIFTHHSMPREPVVVLHTALTNEITNNIESIVRRYRFDGTSSPETPIDNEIDEDPEQITTAIFYSITSTQKGLAGVEMGNYLIKLVVRQLQAEFPHMNQFSSLSPIPGFREWFIMEINKAMHKTDHESKNGKVLQPPLFTESETQELRDLLETPEQSMLDALRHMIAKNSWASNVEVSAALKDPLMRHCARYLYLEKRRSFALNPVANFHLRNGAVLWRLNWMGDPSPRGMGAGCGMMVNYRYYLDQTTQNSYRYMDNYQIAASDQILDLVARSTTGR